LEREENASVRTRLEAARTRLEEAVARARAVVLEMCTEGGSIVLGGRIEKDGWRLQVVTDERVFEEGETNASDWVATVRLLADNRTVENAQGA
jgi:hypothetical protein